MVQLSIRSATSLDLPGILAVNRQSTPGVAKLSRSEVEDILGTAPYVRVAEVASHIVGYLIGYLASSQYWGEEFVWFQDHSLHVIPGGNAGDLDEVGAPPIARQARLV